jgi:outer membrane usher protein
MPLPAYKEWLLIVNFNSTTKNDVRLFLQDGQGEIWADIDTLDQLGFINLNQYPAIGYHGQVYYQLHRFPGLNYQLDKSQLVLTINAPAKLLRNQVWVSDQFIPTLVERPPLGGFFNYDTTGQITKETNQAGGLFTAGIFDHWGVGTYNFLVQASPQDQSPTGNTLQYVRLNTTWQNDFPMAMQTLRLGDTYTAPSLWGQIVGFGGVQWQTNFGTQPNFITFPLPSVNGEAVVPSSVNLLVNNVSAANQKVNPGPFNINSIPVVTGAGTVTAVTTDLLGRQQVISVPYYASAQLLRAGLQNFSYEAGFVRKNYGIASNDYGPFFLAATDNLGVTPFFTEQWHAELLEKQQTAGGGGFLLIQPLGVFSGAIAVSHADEGGMGGLALLGFQRQNYFGLSFGTNIQVSSPAFVELGFDPFTFPSAQSQTYVSSPIPMVKGGSATVAYTLQTNRQSSSASIVTASYSQNLAWNFNMVITGLTNVGGGTHNQAVYLTLSRSLNTFTSFNTGGVYQQNTHQATGTVQLIRTLPPGPGYGYNILVAPGDNANYQVGISAQNNVGTYSLTAADQNGQTGLRGEVSGAIATIDGGGMYLSREIANGFAIVETGIPDIDIYNFNQVIATTNRNGNAFLPNLVAYQNNPITIDPNQIPLNAQIDATKINVIPYFSSGRLVQFPMRMIRAAQMQLLSPSGQPLPAGTTIRLIGNPELFYVGEQGEFYVSGLQQKNKLIATWNGHSCEFTINYPAKADILPQLGKIICEPLSS